MDDAVVLLVGSEGEEIWSVSESRLLLFPFVKGFYTQIKDLKDGKKNKESMREGWREG